ncbi:TIGR00266 family protein [Sporanaerobium hydrogeniformans]|uniref:TIGR00266 family protein n=1 Tax=Sporanaerobium hydrogeniformans TaxID=3072179 RepID=A0AC61D7E7_9FIRM|nr:TIGR00266 family protein [Sporanaerobium hydrogeniformans]PHV69459.1 TIGR00266 family protein [Sporanaerobium hydrogeniformans]
MEYTIFGNDLPGVAIQLKNGESVYTQSGGMAWMENGINMETNVKGGLLKGLGRMFAGESLFMATYSSIRDGAEIVFSSTFPGAIIDFTLKPGQQIIAQKNAFLCAEQSVDLGVEFTRKFSAGMFGGEGFILQRLSGQGTFFLEAAGSIVKRELRPGEVLKVDTGNVVAFESSVRYEIETVKGFANIFFGGEGLFLTKLTGPGVIWLQTLTLQNVAARIIPFIPSNSH